VTRLPEVLEHLATTGAMRRADTQRATMFCHTGDLGTFGQQTYTVVLTVFVRDGDVRAHAEVWLGEMLVPAPPLEVNWPAVKAMRELRQTGQSADVIERLLTAIFQQIA
jgi:hypothetical protein